MTLVYGFLAIGALTTLYPFLVMVTSGFNGPTDQNDGRLVPLFWVDPGELLGKYIDDKYAGDVSLIASTRIGGLPGKDVLFQYEKFLMGLGPTDWTAGFRTPANGVTSRLSQAYQAWLRTKFGDIDAVNARYTELNRSFSQLEPPSEGFDRLGWKPAYGPKWNDWLEFKQTLSAEYRIPVREERAFQVWLRGRFKNRLADVPEEVRATATSFDTLRLVPGPLLDEFRRGRHGPSVEARWAAHHSGPLPIAAFEKQWVDGHAGQIRAEMSGRNYGYVLANVLLDGRTVLNTALFCLLAVLTQLVVNPLAAYALSRVPMRAGAKVLLFLLATMAFPAEVAMIPSFLLLRDLGLLNTLAALVLPTAASGYTIFLLKGFFDSLPAEVFDSGEVDGAPEWVMMLRLALPLAKPVLGYIALLAFMGAYGAFLFAFLVCQDSKTWTLMVHVYQLQLTAPKAVTMAAVTLAAVPSLIVFLLAQRVIMRGIVLPGER
jgi:multiple sugar transport system permease protein